MMELFSSGIDLKSKRPEFKVKHHEIMSKGTQRKESKEVAESELSTKLRTRSERIQQVKKCLIMVFCFTRYKWFQNYSFYPVQCQKNRILQNLKDTLLGKAMQVPLV